ncbi:MAG TPA: periplasmic heavy metal sensor [bacterium]|nr:periplasmic heavy metal sensor [bacterium]
MRAARLLLLAAAGALVLTLPAVGQPPARRDPRTERVIEALLIWRLVDEVNLTDEQIARVFPRIKALKELRIGLGFRKLVLQRELRALLREQPPNEEAIRLKVAELDELRARVEERRERILLEINAVLTLEQRARFALIQETFEAETIRTLEDVRRLVDQHRRR